MTQVLLDKQLQEQQRPTDDEEVKATLMAERNRWFVVAVVAIAAVFVLIFTNYIFASRAAKNTELVYVKLYKDGSREVDSSISGNKRPLVKNVINSDFQNYIESRFGLQPRNIQRQYAEAIVFMAQPLYNLFVSEDTDNGGFDAINKAATIAAAPNNSEIIKIKFDFADHYDFVNGTTSEGKRDVVYRSNFHFTRSTLDSSGNPQGDPEKLILRVQWMLLPMDEMKKKDQDWLSINPLGIEIIDQQLFKDPSA